MCQKHLKAVGVENVSTRDAHARLFTEFTCEANAAKFAFSAIQHSFAGFTYVDLELNTVLD